MKRTLTLTLCLAACLAAHRADSSPAIESISISMDLPSVSVVSAGNGFVDLTADGFVYPGRPARPKIPQKNLFYALPPDVDAASVSITVTKLNYRDESLSHPVCAGAALRFSGAPAAPVFYGDAVNVVDGMDQAVYGRDAFYPESPVAISGLPQMRKWKMARVILSPALYNPRQGLLRVVTHVEFNIEYRRTGRRLQTATASDTVMDAPALTMVQNSGDAQSWYATTTPSTTAKKSGTCYLIMTTDEIYTNSPTVYGLVGHKEDMGFTVHVVTETKLDGNASATGWNEVIAQSPDGRADRMRQWLQDNYIGMQIEYVLLIGNPAPDWGDLPMKKCLYQAYEYPVDGFYADLTGNWDIDGNDIYGNETNDVSWFGGVDMVPEVYVGRIPVYTSDPAWPRILRGIIWKTIKYELEGNTTWRKSALLPEAWSDLYTDGGYLAEHARTDWLTPKGYSAHTLYEQGSVDTNYNSALTSNEELLDNSTARHWMNNAYGLNLWWGHGWSRGAVVYAGGTLFESDQCPMLDNRHPATVFMVSCTCGDPTDDQNISYSMLKNGGIASVAAGEVSWYYGGSWSTDDSPGMNASMGYHFFRRVVSNEMTFGRALAETKEDAVGWWNNYYTFSLYGDPSLRITSHGTDTDGDTMPDSWENDHGLDANDPNDASANPDADSYSNLEEYQAGLDPQVSDAPVSSYTSISVPGTFNGWDPTVNSLKRIEDGIWQGDLVLTNQSNVELKFAANGNWSTNWGEYNQLVTNAPFSGMADWESGNIVLAGTLTGSYRFTFNEYTRGYRVEPTPSTDTDLDGLPDTWENDHDLNSNNGGDVSADPDYDGYNNLQEYQNGTDPHAWNPRAANYSYISAPGTFNSWNPAASNMCLVADHAWRFDTTFTGQSGIEFKFTADGGWAINWGDDDQLEFSPPMAGFGESFGADITISDTLTGSYRFTFDDQLLAYSVEAIATPDTDGDGMSDAWENSHSLNATAASDAGQDADGDGLCNREEYDFESDPADADSDNDGAGDLAEFAAGTNPNDSGSIFSAQTMNVTNLLTLTWPGATGRTYCVYSATGLQSVAWNPLPGYTNITGQAGNMSISVSPPSDDTSRFYKVRVRK